MDSKIMLLVSLLLLVAVSDIENGKVEKTPIIYMRTCELVQLFKYPCEKHTVTTKDGYVLEMHRIPRGISDSNKDRKKPVVFLQHGIMDSSAAWVLNEPNESLGFLLADRGYDVWMGNTRGNTYSEKHLYLTPKDKKFWDYSFSEMAAFDLPAEINYIIKKTKVDNITYIGHSQGTTQAFAAFSSNKKLASKINLFVALAPVVYLSHAKGLLRFLANHSFLTNLILRFLGTKQFLPSNMVIKLLAKYVCGRLIPAKICSCPYFLIVGYNTGNIDLDRLPIYMGHTPAGTSMKSLNHFSQIIKNDRFEMFDYGWNENIKRYQQPKPPMYDIKEMKVPVALFTGEYDWLSIPKDVEQGLLTTLPNIKYFYNELNWNHMDFLWASTAKDKIYNKVFDLMAGKKPNSTNYEK